MSSNSSLLRYRADRKTLSFVFTYFLLAWGGFFAFDYLYESYFWTILVPVCMAACVVSFSVAVIIHNTVHAPIFKNKSHNRIMQFVLSIAHGYSVSAFVPGHNFSHHKEMETAKDIIRTNKARFNWHLMNQLLYFFLVSGDALKYELKWAGKMRKEKPEWFRQWLTESILVNILKISTLFINLPAALVFIWLPQFYGIWGLMGVNLWQHDGCDPNHKYNHSRTFTGKIMNWFCFNNGYHGAHHDRPSLHWSLLPDFHNKTIEPYIHRNLSIDNMPLYFWKTYIYPGKRINYDGSPYVLSPKTEDVDWTLDILVGDKSHKHDFGAESASLESILQINETESRDIIVNEEELTEVV